MPSNPTASFRERLRRRLVEPHAAIQEPDQRRQAALLSSLLLILIGLAVVVESVTVALLTPRQAYTGYQQTMVGVALLAVAYGLSRTRYYRLAAALTTALTSLAVFGSAIAQPEGVLGGFLDYMILSVFLASIYFGTRGLILWLFLDLAGLLVFPFLVPVVTLDSVVVGPVSFLVVFAAILWLFARHRDQLERDRQAELAEKELRYRTLVEQIPAITYLDAVDPATPAGFTALYLSPQFETWLGYSIADIQRHPEQWSALLHPDDRARVERAEARHYADDAGLVEEYRLVTRDQRVIWVRDEAQMRWDAANQRRLSQGLLLDITERKLADDRLRREAARAQALLRVASRLSQLLDLETLLDVISAETARALEVPLAVVYLYDDRRDWLYPAASTGLTSEQRASQRPATRAQYEQAMRERGAAPALALPDLPDRDLYQSLGACAWLSARLEYEGRLVGSVEALAQTASRVFTEDDRMLLRGLADQAALAIVNTQLYKDARRRLDQLQALRAIDIAITTNHDLRETLNILLGQVTSQLAVDAAVVLLLDADQQQLEYMASRGFVTAALRFTRLRLGEGSAGQAALHRRVIQIADLRANPQSFVFAPLLAGEGFISYYAAPLLAQGQVKGVLEVFHRSALEADEEWLAYLEALAGQAAIAIDNTTLFASLQQTNVELSRAYDATIEGWSRALDLRDKETEGHTQRVTEMTLRLADTMGLPTGDRVHIRRGALLHDIGKMGIPDSILLKAGPLTADEWEIMRRHPVYAHEMLLPIAYLRPALDIPYCHHEKWDGTGYPRGLAGDAIPLAARLFAVVDVWDALSSDRPYRAAWPAERVRAHLDALAGTHFDPQVVQAFLPLIAPPAAAEPA